MDNKDVIFISWSGKDTPSFKMAEILYSVLPVIFQSADCFMSDDMIKGAVGINEILNNLSKAKIGIICVTKNNIEKTWLNFEAGALTAVVANKNGKAMPLLIDMTTDELASANSPISVLQGTVLNEEELIKMFLSINNCLGNPLNESQVKQLFDSVAKNRILSCDTTSYIPEIQNKQDIQPEFPMTKDCQRFFKSLYQEYTKRRKDGVSRSDAIKFANSRELSELLGLPFDDVECCSRELHKLDLLKCHYADNIVLISFLTEKGIKYGEENFDEPTYIQLLREIVEIYASRKAPIPNERFNNYQNSDFSILKTKGYIVETSKYLNGHFLVKPTDSGIAELALKE